MSNDTPPLASITGEAVYLVLDDLGSMHGRVYRETSEAEADETSTAAAILDGRYKRPVRVIAFKTTSGGSA
jgi:hypothetical protein